MRCCFMEKEIISKYDIQLRARYYLVFTTKSRFFMKVTEENINGKKNVCTVSDGLINWLQWRDCVIITY